MRPSTNSKLPWRSPGIAAPLLVTVLRKWCTLPIGRRGSVDGDVHVPEFGANNSSNPPADSCAAALVCNRP